MTRRERPSQVPRLGGARAAVLAVLVVLGPAMVYAAGDEAAEGRKHAQRASHLAASGKCRQALGEFDKAIAVLHDPTLLFNRGECHRKLGAADAALEDYNQFLSDLPNAPNRAQVEARIAELRSKKPAPAGATSPTAPESSAPRAPVPAAAVPPGLRVEVAPTPGVASPVPALDVAPPPPAPSPTTAPGTALATPAEPAPSGAAASGGDSLTSRPWFWIALGAVVVGAGVGAYLVLAKDPTNIPKSDLGNYRF